MAYDLNGKRALVVGASAGIGRAIAARLATYGATVAWCGRRKERLDEAVAQYGGHAVVADVSDDAQCAQLVDDAVGALGGLDVIVYAVGQSRLHPLAQTEGDDWRSILATNVVAPALVTRAALGHLSEAAVVAFLSSESVGAPMHGLVPYTVSKSALEELVRGWRVEQPEVRFVCARVGATADTEFGRDFDPQIGAELIPKWLASGRVTGSFMISADVATVVADVVTVALLTPGIDLHDVVVRPPAQHAMTMDPDEMQSAAERISSENK